MRPFDEQFGENVRDAFDNYREPVDEVAWKHMKSRLQARSKKRLLAFTPLFIRAAASIAFLIAISGSLWLLVLNQGKPDMATTYGVHEETIAPPAKGSGDTPSLTGQPDKMTGLSPGEVEETRETGGIRGTVGPGETSGSPEIEDSRNIAGTTPAPDAPEIANIPVIPGAVEMPDSPPVSDIGEVPGTRPIAGLPLISAISGLYSRGVTSNLVSSKQPADTDTYIISRNLESMGKVVTGSHRNPVVEVSAGSMKTWSPGEIAGGLGYTAGVSGDWQIGRRMSIHGGGHLVYNQFSLENTLVSAKHYQGQEFALASGTDMSREYNVLNYQNSHSNIEFTALDLPVNIRFTVKEAPGSRIFLSAGFSSFLYLQQKYSSESTVLASYSRLNPQGHYESATGYAHLTSGGEFSAFGRFDLARFLNLSGGYVIRGRNQAIIIEPFLKYPLGDVTNLNLNIGMTGLSLKYLPGSR